MVILKRYILKEERSNRTFMELKFIEVNFDHGGSYEF